MIRTSIRVCALALCCSALLFAGCSGSRSDTLNTQNIGRSDAAAIVEEDAEVDAEIDEEDAGEDAGQEIVVIEVDDAGEAPDVTVIIEVALCGNGHVDPDEECDQGASNSNTAVDACRSNCRRARCGDGVIDQGEACDDGANNSDTTADACRPDCQRARCGDGTVDKDEQCDSADARSDTTPGACRLSCRSARCGDGVVDTDEGCDDGNQVDTDACRNSCRAASCGDGRMDPGEQCDDGNDVNTDACRDTCQRPSCGDRIVDSGEECDDGNSVNNDGCRMCRRGCRTADDCSDGQFCNGAERCVDGQCMAALRPANPDDGIACTDDACVEASDSFSHTPNDARCMAPAVSCGDVAGAPTRMNPTVRCVAGSGCVVTSTNTPCPDQATTCGQAGGRLLLTTYEPACNPDAMSCAAAQPTSEDCGPATGSCSRVGVYTPPGNCSVRDLNCAPAATQDCRGQSWSCASDNSSATPTNGTCDPGSGCGRAVGTAVPCDDPPDTCANAVRRIWTPSCGAGGCGTATFVDRACPGTRSTACGAFGPNGQDALQDYAPACADGSTCARSTVATGDPRVCNPTRASTCSTPAGANIPAQVNYTPLCANGSSCSTVGTPSAAVPCIASSSQRCATVAGLGRRFFFQPSCDATSSTCLPNGLETSEPCPALTGTRCTTYNRLASLVRYQPACRDATGCATDGVIDPASVTPCTTRPAHCTNGTTEARWNNQCSSATECGTTDIVCGRQPAFCSSDRASILRYSGACEENVGCVTATQQVCPAASCGAPAGAAPQFCTAGVCGAGPNGAVACNRTCTPCVTGCELNAAGARTGNFCPGCGTDSAGNPICQPCTPNRQCQSLTTGLAGGTFDPSLGGTTAPGTITVAPGAILSSQ